MTAGRVRWWTVLLGLVALNIVLYAPSLDNGFSLDDYNWLERAEYRASSWSFVFAQEPGQILNPVPRALFLGLYGVAGLEPLPYRLVVLGIHVLTASLLCCLVVELGAHRWLGVLAAVLFSLHTAYDEALFWIAAYFHPLVGLFTLATLLSFVRFVRTGGRWGTVACGLCFLAGCLTKASAFVVLAPATCWLLPPPRDPAQRRRGAGLLAGLGAILAAVLLLNLAAGISDSYLLERGYYRDGPHLLANLAHYTAWLALPFREVLGLLRLESAYDAAFGVARWLMPAVLLALALAGSRAVRTLSALALAALIPFLPFVFEPVSRYTYLATASACGVAGLLVGRISSAWKPRRRVSAATAGIALAGLLLASVADTRLRDNRYEYRERAMAIWLDDVTRAIPDPQAGAIVEIAGLPRLGIDPGIHLQAALRLHFENPTLDLRVVPEDAPVTPGAIRLEHRDGRIGQAGP